MPTEKTAAVNSDESSQYGSGDAERIPSTAGIIKAANAAPRSIKVFCGLPISIHAQLTNKSNYLLTHFFILPIKIAFSQV